MFSEVGGYFIVSVTAYILFFQWSTLSTSFYTECSSSFYMVFFFFFRNPSSLLLGIGMVDLYQKSLLNLIMENLKLNYT